MFNKVLIVEDLDSIGYGIAQMLTKEVKIENITQSLYCDDAYLKFLRAEKDNCPFNLVISDLSFIKDHRENRIKSGGELVKILKEKNPNVKTIIYSVEDRQNKIKKLFENNKIDGYVIKGRDGNRNLIDAVKTLNSGEKFIPPQFLNFNKKNKLFEIEDYDVLLLQELSNGYTQEQIASNFKNKEISPNSISSIEKRLNKLKLEFKAKNTIHLVANAKDLGVI